CICHAMPCCVALFLCLCAKIWPSVEPESRTLVQEWTLEIRFNAIVSLSAPSQTNHLLDRSALFNV
ncbi:hypothetical protein ACHAQJ_009684, partial [Trichoderma viride]